MNWDDLRFVLALGRSGTLKDAAESLGVHYTSVARKIKQFEESLGTRLFDSHPRQQVLTPHGEKLMQVAERIENEIFALDRELLGKESQLSGLLRISTIEPIAMAHCKDFADFIELHPDVELEIIADTSTRDLSKRESDIALRATKKPPEHLLGRQVATMRFAPFAMPELIERQGAGTPIEDWPWVHWTMEGARPMWKPWLEKVNSGNGKVISVSNGAVFNQMVESGNFVGYLAKRTANLTPALQQVGPWQPEIDIPIWMLTHPDLRHTARIKAFMDFMGPRMKVAHEVPEL
jgi:DNA-binding transcriptional LysR family regulator